MTKPLKEQPTSSARPGQDENTAPPAPAPTPATADTILSPTQIMRQRLILAEPIQTSVRNAIAIQEETSRELLALANRYAETRSNILQMELLAVNHLTNLDKDLHTLFNSSSSSSSNNQRFVAPPVDTTAAEPGASSGDLAFPVSAAGANNSAELVSRYCTGGNTSGDLANRYFGSRSAEQIQRDALHFFKYLEQEQSRYHTAGGNTSGDLASRIFGPRSAEQIEQDAFHFFHYLLEQEDYRTALQDAPDQGRPRPFGAPPRNNRANDITTSGQQTVAGQALGNGALPKFGSSSNKNNRNGSTNNNRNGSL